MMTSNGGQGDTESVTYYPVLAPDFDDEPPPRSLPALKDTSNLIAKIDLNSSEVNSTDVLESNEDSTDEIASCISTFLACVDREEGSGANEEESRLGDESSPCYRAFQAGINILPFPPIIIWEKSL